MPCGPGSHASHGTLFHGCRPPGFDPYRGALRMIVGTVIAGVVLLVVGWAFYWLNLNTPVQTCIPAVALPLGAGLILIAIGGAVL
jgi:hypothetical protein